MPIPSTSAGSDRGVVMCGIAGILRFDGREPPPDRIGAMLEHMRHRGPDDGGVRALGACTLAHRRLSILDLAGGAQPMAAPAIDGHGELWVVFNGLIYNHRALRRRLEQAGHRFATDHSDTEVLLHGFRQWGWALAGHLEGMFALAMWDRREHRLYLARDRLGKKPLYLWRRRDELAFASLIGTLVAGSADAPAAPDPAALLQFLRLGDSLGPRLVAGVEELAPGHWLSVGLDGAVTCHAYWQLPPPPGGAAPRRRASGPGPDSTATALDAVRPLLDAAVRARLDADVPIGCFLSGGIDSSVVAAVAQRELGAAGAAPLRTFSVAMPVAAYDERDAARMVARHIGSEHHELLVQPCADVLADLDTLTRQMGQPTADSSILPTYWLSRAARTVVKVALSGDGGDELFLGYDRYRAMKLLQRHRRLFRVAGRLLARPDPARPRGWYSRLHRLGAAAAETRPACQYRLIMQLFSDAQIRELGLAVDGPPAALPDWADHADPIWAARHWDLGHYLPHDLLAKVDRASMSAGLEVRCPLLDAALCELVCCLPVPLLMPAGRPKGLLRALAAPLLPPPILRRPKRGFALPIGHWFRGPLRNDVADRLLGSALVDLGLHRRAVERLWREHDTAAADHTHRLFALLGLALWWRGLQGRTRSAVPPPPCPADPR